jgi:hypothetical protein
MITNLKILQIGTKLNSRKIAIAFLIATTIAALSSPLIFNQAAQAQVQNPNANRNPGSLPPTSQFRGGSLAELADTWWQLFYSLDTSVTGNPFADLTGALCNVGLQGNMLFLVGTTGGVQPENQPRTCTISPGTSILIPLVNVVCNNLEVGTPFFGADEAAQRTCANGIIDLVDTGSLIAAVDGVNVQPVRVQSPPGGFQFTAVANNPFAIPTGPTGTGSGVADGYWLLLHPLPPGEHIITVGASIPEFGFQTGVTYKVIVQPPGRT